MKIYSALIFAISFCTLVSGFPHGTQVENNSTHLLHTRQPQNFQNDHPYLGFHGYYCYVYTFLTPPELEAAGGIRPPGDWVFEPGAFNMHRHFHPSESNVDPAFHHQGGNITSAFITGQFVLFDSFDWVYLVRLGVNAFGNDNNSNGWQLATEVALLGGVRLDQVVGWYSPDNHEHITLNPEYNSRYDDDPSVRYTAAAPDEMTVTTHYGNNRERDAALEHLTQWSSMAQVGVFPFAFPMSERVQPINGNDLWEMSQYVVRAGPENYCPFVNPGFWQTYLFSEGAWAVRASLELMAQMPEVNGREALQAALEAFRAGNYAVVLCMLFQACGIAPLVGGVENAVFPPPGFPRRPGDDDGGAAGNAIGGILKRDNLPDTTALKATGFCYRLATYYYDPKPCVRTVDSLGECTYPEQNPCSVLEKLYLSIWIPNWNYAGTNSDISVQVDAAIVKAFSKPSADAHVVLELPLKRHYPSRGERTTIRTDWVRSMQILTQGNKDQWALAGVRLIGKCEGDGRLITMNKFANLNQWMKFQDDGQKQDISRETLGPLGIKNWMYPDYTNPLKHTLEEEVNRAKLAAAEDYKPASEYTRDELK